MYGFAFQDIGRLFLALIVLATLACTPFATAADRALLVGVGDYAQVSDLPRIDLDVDMMREVAERLGFGGHRDPGQRRKQPMTASKAASSGG